MSTIDLSQPYTIHLGVDETQFERLTRDASTRQMMVFQLDLTGLVDRVALADYLAQEFMYPFPTSGLDAAISLISDLEWFGNTNGHVVIARGLSAPSEVGETFVSPSRTSPRGGRPKGPHSLSPLMAKAMNYGRPYKTPTITWMNSRRRAVRDS